MKNWFELQQKLLLWLANNKYGRDLLNIENFFPRIIKITPNSITGFVDYRNKKITKISNFYSRKVYQNLIIQRWKEFQELASYYYSQQRKPILFPVYPVPLFAYAVSTFNPDANPETTSVDGYTRNNVAEDTFAIVRNGAGTEVGDSNTNWVNIAIQAGTTTDKWIQIYRGIYLFDTSSILDDDDIGSATLDLYYTLNDIPLGSLIINVVASTPASNTALAIADYSQFGATDYSNDFAQSDISLDAYNSHTLNASGLAAISKTGISKFGLRFANDIDNIAPTWSSLALNRTRADFADGTNKPKLVVTHITWTNESQNTTSFTNESQNTTSFTNESQNTTAFTNESQNTTAWTNESQS